MRSCLDCDNITKNDVNGWTCNYCDNTQYFGDIKSIGRLKDHCGHFKQVTPYSKEERMWKFKESLHRADENNSQSKFNLQEHK